MKNDKEFSDKIDLLQMCINIPEISKGAPKKFLSSSHRAQVVENQTEALIIRVTDLKWKFKFQSQKVLVVKSMGINW